MSDSVSAKLLQVCYNFATGVNIASGFLPVKKKENVFEAPASPGSFFPMALRSDIMKMIPNKSYEDQKF